MHALTLSVICNNYITVCLCVVLLLCIYARFDFICDMQWWYLCNKCVAPTLLIYILWYLGGDISYHINISKG